MWVNLWGAAQRAWGSCDYPDVSEAHSPSTPPRGWGVWLAHLEMGFPRGEDKPPASGWLLPLLSAQGGLRIRLRPVDWLPPGPCGNRPPRLPHPECPSRNTPSTQSVPHLCPGLSSLASQGLQGPRWHPVVLGAGPGLIWTPQPDLSAPVWGPGKPSPGDVERVRWVP